MTQIGFIKVECRAVSPNQPRRKWIIRHNKDAIEKCDDDQKVRLAIVNQSVTNLGVENLQIEWDAGGRSLMKKWWATHGGEDEKPLHNNYNRFPLRGVNQGNFVAIEDIKLCELGLVVKPTVKMHNRLRKLVESPTGHRGTRCRRVTDGELSENKIRRATPPSNWKQSQQPWITTITI